MPNDTEQFDAVQDGLVEDRVAEQGEKLSPTEQLLARLDQAQLQFEAKQAEFAKYLDEVKKHEENVNEIKAAIFSRMEETGVKNLETEHFKITATWATKRHTYDMKALESLNPKLYAQVDTLVGKDTPVKGYVKITTKSKK